jgi:hypothetical protein
MPAELDFSRENIAEKLKEWKHEERVRSGAQELCGKTPRHRLSSSTVGRIENPYPGDR